MWKSASERLDTITIPNTAKPDDVRGATNDLMMQAMNIKELQRPKAQ